MLRDPGGDGDVEPEEVVTPPDHLAAVQPHAHPDPARTPSGVPHLPAACGDRPLGRDRAGDRVAGAPEGEHEPVALCLHLVTAVPPQLLAHEPVVLFEDVQPAAVSEPLVEGGGALDVGEHEGERPVGRRRPAHPRGVAQRPRGEGRDRAAHRRGDPLVTELLDPAGDPLQPVGKRHPGEAGHRRVQLAAPSLELEAACPRAQRAHAEDGRGDARSHDDQRRDHQDEDDQVPAHG